MSQPKPVAVEAFKGRVSKAAMDAMPRFRHRPSIAKAAGEVQVYAFPFRRAAVVLMIGPGYWGLVPSAEFNRRYMPSNKEAHLAWDRHAARWLANGDRVVATEKGRA